MPHLFENAFTHAAIGMALVGLDGRWLQVNPSLCRLIGYSEAELLACTFQDVTHPEDLDTDLEYVDQLLRGEIETYQMEKRYRRKDGRIVWVLLSVSLAHSIDDGKPLFFISQLQDITARKEAEQDRDIMFDLPLLFRAVLGADGYFQRLSPQWTKILGYSRKVLMAKRVTELVHPDDVVLTKEAITEILTGQRLQLFQNRLRRADGSYLWLMWCGKGVPERGLGFAVAMDVTPLKEAETRAIADAREKQRLYEELRAATEEVRSFQQGLVTICAWTKQVRRGTNWVSLEEFLCKQLHFKLTHGISDEIAERMLEELREPEKK
jgi:PAS domain S-box-containing protein